MAEKKSAKMDEKTSRKDEEILGRDTIYVDTDDDITSVIGKIKNSKNSVIALVPPARAGVLQSVVNLKLLQRAAKTSRKKLSLITNDKALVSLASGLKIPVAKNLSAQADVPVSRNDFAKDDKSEIDGKDFAVGELAALEPEDQDFAKKPSEAKEAAAVAAIETDDEIRGDEKGLAPNDDEPKVREKPAKSAKDKKVPNFNSFRKKLLIFGGLAILLIGFLVWAFAIAPGGTITVVAKTSDKPISGTVNLVSSATNIGANNLNVVTKTSRTTETTNITPSGKVMTGGAKATGEISLTNHSTTNFNPNTGASNDINLTSGTTVSINGQIFTTNSSVKIPANGGTNTVNVTAAGFGAAYNVSANSPVKVAGYDQATQLDGAANGAFSGGQDQTQQVMVQQSDVDAVSDSLKAKFDQSSAQNSLTSQMGSGVKIIDGSFATSFGAVTPSIAVGQPVPTGTQVTASVNVNSYISGVSNDDLNAWLSAQAGNGVSSGQKVYKNGIDNIKFANFVNGTVNISATAQIGLNLDANQIKQLSLGKKSAEIRSDLMNKYSNVSDVKVDFAPFWISSISDASRLNVNFQTSN